MNWKTVSDSQEDERCSFSFIGYVENYGRSFELGLATRYHLTHSPLKKFSLGPFALDMIRKDRIALRPEKIKGIGQLRKILEKAKTMEVV